MKCTKNACRKLEGSCRAAVNRGLNFLNAQSPTEMSERCGSPTLSDLYNRRHRIRPVEDLAPIVVSDSEETGRNRNPDDDDEEIIIVKEVLRVCNKLPLPQNTSQGVSTKRQTQQSQVKKSHALINIPSESSNPDAESNGLGTPVVEDRSCATSSRLHSPARLSSSSARVNEVFNGVQSEAERGTHSGLQSIKSRFSTKEVRYIDFQDRPTTTNNETSANPKELDCNQQSHHSRSRSPVAVALRNGSRNSELCTNRREPVNNKGLGNAKEFDWEHTELGSGSERRVRDRNNSKSSERRTDRSTSININESGDAEEDWEQTERNSTSESRVWVGNDSKRSESSSNRRAKANTKKSANTAESYWQQRHSRSRSRSPLRISEGSRNSERSTARRETTNYDPGSEYPSSSSRDNRRNRRQSQHNNYHNKTRDRKWSEGSISSSTTPYYSAYRRYSEQDHYSHQRSKAFNRRDLERHDTRHHNHPLHSRRLSPDWQSDDHHQHSNASNRTGQDEYYNANQQSTNFGSETKPSSFSIHYPIQSNSIPQTPTQKTVDAPQSSTQSSLLSPSNSNQPNMMTPQISTQSSLLPPPNSNQHNLISSSNCLLSTPNNNLPSVMSPQNDTHLRLSPSQNVGNDFNSNPTAQAGICPENSRNRQESVESWARTPIRHLSVGDALKLIRTCREADCSMEGHMFYSRKEAIEHLAKVHDKELCFVCFETIRKTGADHRNHVSNEHEDIKALSACPITHCGVRFSYGGMYQHQVKAHYLEQEGIKNHTSRRGGSNLVKQRSQTNIPLRTSPESNTQRTHFSTTIPLRNPSFNLPAAASASSKPLPASSTGSPNRLPSTSSRRISSAPTNSHRNDTRENNNNNTNSTSVSGGRHKGSSEQRSIWTPSASVRSSSESHKRKSNRASSKESNTTNSTLNNVACGRPLQLIQNQGGAAIEDVERNLANQPKDTLRRYKIPKKSS